LNEKSQNFNPNSLKLKKSVILNSPIFSVRYSHFFPNILAACDESGYITIIDSNISIKHSNPNNTQNEIEPIHRIQIQDNSIFDFDWCTSDSKLISASGSAKCIMYSIEKLVQEYTFTGHCKSVKCVKQAFYNDNLFASCGRDGMILLWDIRERNKNEELMV
jgi:WD40 repeat protein